MGKEIFDLIRKVSMFLIVTQLILHVRPAKEYEKYMKFLIHMMALAMLALPLLKGFSDSEGALWKGGSATYEDILKGEFAQVSDTCEKAENLRKELCLQEINLYGDSVTDAKENGEVNVQNKEVVVETIVIGVNGNDGKQESPKFSEE